MSHLFGVNARVDISTRMNERMETCMPKSPMLMQVWQKYFPDTPSWLELW